MQTPQPLKPVSPKWTLADERQLALMLARLEALEPKPKTTKSHLDNLDWRDWLAKYFPHIARCAPSKRHARLWNWFSNLTPEIKPLAQVETWPRGGAKSSTAELATTWIGSQSTLRRRFVLYVSETQPQADKHVQAIAALFERLEVERAINRYGSSKGWRRDQLRTESGFNVAAFGLLGSARGVKLEEFRPDLIVFDDFDSRHDTAATVQKKGEIITDTVLPAGSSDCAILFLQNLIHTDSIMAQLVDGRADFLLNRETASVEPAVMGLEYEVVESSDGKRSYRITGGKPTWEGQNLKTCEAQMNEWGASAFKREAQQEVDDDDDGLWQEEWIEKSRKKRNEFGEYELPIMERVVVGIDPSGGAGICGIVAKARAMIGPMPHYYVLQDATPPKGTSPGGWVERALDCYVDNKADAFAVEINFGGQMAETILRRAAQDRGVAIRIIEVSASRGKQVRAEPVAELSEKGYEHHVGYWSELEKEKRKWKPGEISPNRLDADVWATVELMKASSPPSPQSTVRKTWIR